jgi:ABC-type transport system substrate-binding protein
MDHPSAPYHDLQVRQALSMAIDRETLGKAIYAGQYSKNGVIPAVLGKWALPPDQLGDASKYYDYNPDAARKIVQSNPAAKQLKRFLYPSVYYGTQFDTLCQSVNAMLNAVGFETQLVAIDYNKDFIGGGKGALYGNYPDDSLLASREGIHNNAETTLSYNFQTGDDHNLAKASDPQLDADLAKMMSTLDDNARLQAAYALQRYAAAQVYLIPLPSEFAYTLVAPRVQSYFYAPSSNEGQQTFPNLWLQQ